MKRDTKKLPKRVFVAFVIFLSLVFYLPVSAQGGDEAYYMVQEGDTLWSIATRFGVSLKKDVQQAKNITDPGQVRIGASLVIPGCAPLKFARGTETLAIWQKQTCKSGRHYSKTSLSPHEVFYLNW